MTKYIKSTKAFTLIELLVVIAVVSILAGVVLMQIKPNLIVQKGRDSKRMQELNTLAKAINLALAEDEITLTANGASCTTCSSNTGTQVSTGSGYVKFVIPVGKTGLSKYLSTLPIDPVNSGNYVYRFGSTTSDFELNAVFEHPDNVNLMSTDGGNASAVYEIGTSLSIL